MFYNALLLCVIAEKRQMKKFYKKVDDPPLKTVVHELSFVLNTQNSRA